jgi:hypothetical protein
MRQEHYKCREAIDPTMDPPGVQIRYSSGSRNSLLGADAGVTRRRVDDDEGDAVRAIAKHIATRTKPLARRPLRVRYSPAMTWVVGRVQRLVCLVSDWFYKAKDSSSIAAPRPPFSPAASF